MAVPIQAPARYTPPVDPIQEAVMAEFRSGLLYCGDNLTIMPQLPRECIDLIYIDPPFFSSRAYEIIYGDTRERRSFEDRWKGGIRHYVGWMEPRLRQMHALLQPTGSFYIHLDSHAVHYLKVLLDDIFGASKFRNEIIWKRTSAHSSANRYGPNFDTILFYTKSDEYTWNRLYQPQDPHYVKTHYTGKDEHFEERGPYRTSDLTASGIRYGSSGKLWRGFDPNSISRHWICTVERLEDLDREGRIHWPSRGGWPAYKRYLNEVRQGTPLQALWTDVPPINSQAKERLGYPTQKPEALLQRIVQASSNPDELVADFFCGCGTTLVAAQRLGRRWIGGDVSPSALRVVRDRLQSQLGAEDVELVNYPYEMDELNAMDPFEFENYVVDFMSGTHAPPGSRDQSAGIDGFTFFNANPIQVKQMDRVGAPVVQRFVSAIQRKRKSMGYIVAFGFTRDAWSEVARVKGDEGISIELIQIQDAVQQEPLPEFP